MGPDGLPGMPTDMQAAEKQRLIQAHARMGPQQFPRMDRSLPSSELPPPAPKPLPNAEVSQSPYLAGTTSPAGFPNMMGEGNMPLASPMGDPPPPTGLQTGGSDARAMQALAQLAALGPDGMGEITGGPQYPEMNYMQLGEDTNWQPHDGEYPMPAGFWGDSKSTASTVMPGQGRAPLALTRGVAQDAVEQAEMAGMNKDQRRTLARGGGARGGGR